MASIAVFNAIKRTGFLWFVLCLSGIAMPVQALLLESRTLPDGRKILLLRDCGTKKSKDKNCWEHEEKFTTGDADRLRRALSNGRYDEVWLWSGGGDLEEGLKVGQVLRRHQMTVRVPNDTYCISACTVAFMGGFFRFIDKEATYEVHAYSRFLNGLNPSRVDRMLADPEAALNQFAKNEYATARTWAARLMAHFQEGVRGKVNQIALSRWRKEYRQPPAYLNSRALKTDAVQIKVEGVAAALEILMRIEREAMENAIHDLRAKIDEFGPRANYGLDMLKAMFSSRIMLTASLSQETLLKMGYITKIAER